MSNALDRKAREATVIKNELTKLKSSDGQWALMGVMDSHLLTDYIQERTALAKIEAVDDLINIHVDTTVTPSLETLEAFQEGQKAAYIEASQTKDQS